MRVRGRSMVLVCSRVEALAFPVFGCRLARGLRAVVAFVFAISVTSCSRLVFCPSLSFCHWIQRAIVTFLLYIILRNKSSPPWGKAGLRPPKRPACRQAGLRRRDGQLERLYCKA